MNGIAPHGSPYDRGMSDSYYRRPERPHKWLDRIGAQRVDDLNPEEIEEYRAGYDWNDEYGDKKDWRE